MPAPKEIKNITQVRRNPIIEIQSEHNGSWLDGKSSAFFNLLKFHAHAID
jgi:hypothetical protein